MGDNLLVDLASGEIEVTITDQIDISLDKTPLVEQLKSTGHPIAKEYDLHKIKTKNSDVGMFRAYYVQVKALESSVFTLHSKKVGASYHEIMAGHRNIFRYSEGSKEAFYYKVDPDFVKTIKLVFEIKNNYFFSHISNSAMVFESQNDLIKNTDFYYLNEESFGEMDKDLNREVKAEIIKQETIDDPD